jgi:hypothetical protein
MQKKSWQARHILADRAISMKFSALSVLSVDKKWVAGDQSAPSPFEHFVVQKECITKFLRLL